MATALLNVDTLTSLCDETAEVRFWDGEDAGNRRMIQPYDCQEESAFDVQINGRVKQLVSWEAEDPDALMRDLQTEVREGNRRIAYMLASAFYLRTLDVDARGLALETLAAARARWFENQVVQLVRSALDAPETELQFAGIAAASDLSQTNQVAMSRIIRTFALSPNLTVKRAAEAFLRKVNKGRLVLA
jgi:hypothetical protein